MGNEAYLRRLTARDRHSLWMTLRHRAMIVRIHRDGIHRDRALVAFGEAVAHEREFQRQLRLRRRSWLPSEAGMIDPGTGCQGCAAGDPNHWLGHPTVEKRP